MTKYLSLLKVLFVQQFRARPTSNSKKRNKKSTKIVVIIIMVIALLPLLSMMAGATYFLGYISRGINNSSTVAFLILICQGLVLLFGLPSVITNVFTPRDADKLLYLPLKSTTIFSAKLSVVYINEVITSTVTMLVLLLPFAIGSQAGFNYYILMPFACLLLPILPLVLGSIIAIPISAIIRRISKNGIAKAIFQMLVFGIYITLYLLFLSSITSIDASVGEGATAEQMLQLLLARLQEFLLSLGSSMKWIFPNYFLASAMTTASFGTTIGYFAATLAVNAVLMALVVLIAMPTYTKTLTAQQESSGGNKKISLDKFDYSHNSKGLVANLMLTDFKRVIRDSNMGFQMLMSVVMMPLMVIILGIAFTFGAGEEASSLFKTNEAIFVIPLVLFGYMSFLSSGANAMGLYPISRENKSFNMLKFLPIPIAKLLFAKVLLATVLMLLGNLACVIAGAFMFGIDWYVLIFMFISMSLYQFGSMCITTYVDVKHPMLGWTSFNSSLKNAKNSLLGLLCGFLSSVVIALIAVVFSVWYFATLSVLVQVLMWFVLIIIGVVYAVVTFNIVKNNGEKAFAEIEV